MLALAAVVLAVVGIAATAALRSYLATQDDEQLESTFDEVVRQLDQTGGLAGTREIVVPPGAFGDVLDVAGVSRTVNHTTTQGEPDLPTLDQAAVRAHNGIPFTVPSVGDDSTAWRVLTRSYGPNYSVVVAISLADTDRTVRRLVLLQLGLGGGALTILAFAASFVIRRSLRPLEDIESIAERIAAGDLTRRVPDLDQRTEVGRLAASLNGMLARIESAVRERADAADRAQRSEQRMRSFVADASHELRTPLTSIRGFAELYRQGAVSEPDEVPRVMSRIEGEAARMNVLVEDMLLLARMDERRPMAFKPVNLMPIAADAVYDARAVAPDRDVRLVLGPGLRDGEAGHGGSTVDAKTQAAAGLAFVDGDEVRLRQVIGNLVSNALVHTPPGTPVEVHLALEDAPPRGGVVVAVVDHGAGLAPEQAERVFERFYRTDTARSRVQGGSGLGLAIVAAIVAGHGGVVDVRPTPGGGATFVVRLAALPREALR